MTSRSQLYPNARQLFATAGLNWATSNIKIALMTAAYNPNFANVYLSDLDTSNLIVTSGNITGLSATNGYLTGDTTGLGVIADPRAAGALVFYKDTGTSTTSPLIGFIDTPDLPGLPQVLVGFNYFVYKNVSYGGWFRL